jgi:asparaginyl-tRNA synthetase
MAFKETEGASYLTYLRTDQAQAIFRLSQAVTNSLREYLDGKGFIEFLPPVVSSVTDPGLRGAERLPVSMYNCRAYVTSSMVFHKQVLATAFRRIYAFAPNVRLEPLSNAESGRHLVEFCQLDLEEADATFEDSMALAEEMLRATIAVMVDKWNPLLQALGRELHVPESPFRRFSYGELLGLAESIGAAARYGEELPQAVESAVSAEVGGFFWVTGYPKECRGFYYRESGDGATLRSMDLIFPEGYGEAISGGEREYRPGSISRRIRESGLDPAEFSEFLAIAEGGLSPTSGFGIGVERLVRYICGQPEISRVRPFPKTPGAVTM